MQAIRNLNAKGVLMGLLLPALAINAQAGVNFFDPTNSAQVPNTLEATGIYQDIQAKTLDTALKYFEVNAALWSDAAHKDRWIILPPGKSVTYNDTTDVFEYPESTIFVKLFRHDTLNVSDSSSRIYWETRLLVKKTTGNVQWHGFSYKWNKGASQAYLVSREAGFDTALTLGMSPGYRKWHFPSAGDCERCHIPSGTSNVRGVLGFFPAQLKRPAYKYAPGKNQVIALFDMGVFTGTRPVATLGKRWRGMSEPIPTGLSAEERFKVIDTMARAYIAANCSGCHGNKGLEAGATQGCAPNFDYYNLVPMMEFGTTGSGGWGLDGNEGRMQFLSTLKEWSIPTGYNTPGTFDLSLPPAGNYPMLLYPGHPTFSSMIFRQAARKSPKVDSVKMVEHLSGNNASGWANWIFKAPWGSKAWLDSLKAHNVRLEEALLVDFGGFSPDGAQMPPLATYIPDTTAMKIMGEWAKTYRSDSVSSVRSANIALLGGSPRIQNRVLMVPEGWTGPAIMTSLDGRAYKLTSAGKGRYTLPSSLPKGVYFFKVGSRSFRTSIVR
jgi:hypothetical protein